MVNFIQITVYDDGHHTIADLTMSGSSEQDSDFNCDAAQDLINNALDLMELDPFAEGVKAVLNAVCHTV